MNQLIYDKITLKKFEVRISAKESVHKDLIQTYLKVYEFKSPMFPLERKQAITEGLKLVKQENRKPWNEEFVQTPKVKV
jgi:hypothetical protein